MFFVHCVRLVEVGGLLVFLQSWSDFMVTSMLARA